MFQLTIQQRFAFWAGSSLIITILVCAGVGLWQFSNISQQLAIQSQKTLQAQADNYLKAVSSQESQTVASRFEQTISAAATMTDATSQIVQTNIDSKRNLIIEFQKEVLKNNPNFLGNFIAFEPNALDGQDALFRGEIGQDDNGRFQPYVARSGLEIVLASLEGLEDQTRDENGLRAGDYYLCPKDNRRRCVVGPYLYPVDGQEVLLATVSAPIIVNGALIGAAGIDISAAFIQRLITDTASRLYQGAGSAILLSSSGVIAGHSSKPESVGKNINILPTTEQQQIRQAISSSSIVTNYTNEQFVIATPFNIDQDPLPWVLYLSLPTAVVLADVAAQQQTLDTASQQFTTALTIIGLLLAALGIGIVWLVSRNSIAPLKDMTSMVAAIAEGEGDLTQRLSINRKDEVGQLAGYVNSFISRLQTMISQLVQVGAQVRTLSAEGTAIGRQTDEQVKQQQQLIEQIVTAVTQMSATAQDVARSAANAAEAVRQADNAANKGNSVVQQTVQAVSNVERSSSQAKDAMLQLEANSNEIISILGVIQGIAEQTNLLALNAAIEAARAGEQGRGFAVVADEVRALAARTRTATEDIRLMLSTLQEGSRNAAGMMQTSSERVNESVQLAKQAEGALADIKDAISQISQMNFQIATATEEQSAVCEDVNKNITRIAAAVSDTAEAARSLRQLGQQQDNAAATLQKQLGQFKV
ncbi:chemotaxis transducer [Alishewanella longhuensis]|uniref:Chemotaxis transducer n=1 Tax=Alishewanella longhuensis TaxID=1091037 RepID=A0ABQ3KVM4_9ALTE|nr:methyl-accepting chemotaxis protein [Alishewanella longhuensis]GHG63002.1 chemotaxis transducer [Alishewanella longhuensis]